MGKQPACPRGRPFPQLYILYKGRVDQEPAHLHHSSGDLHCRNCACLEGWKDLVQHNLSCRFHTGAALPLQPFRTCNQKGQVRQLRTMHQGLQGFLHRLQEPQDRLQPLRRLYGLPRTLPQRRNQLQFPLWPQGAGNSSVSGGR